MREIKFRAWNSNTKETLPVTFTGVLTPDSVIGLYKSDGKNIFDIWGLPAWKYIRIMQYTGLKDKNGKEIYEGDIVQFKFYENESELEKQYSKAVVKWSDISCGFAPMSESPIALESIEVIGNIYEDSEWEETK